MTMIFVENFYFKIYFYLFSDKKTEKKEKKRKRISFVDKLYKFHYIRSILISIKQIEKTERKPLP